MLLMLNNRDSFVFNLARYFSELGEDIQVRDSHTITITEIEAMAPDALIISSGPCTPREAGVSLATVRHFADRLPILGVCLGHQVIAEAFGWKTERSNAPKHGHAVPVSHHGADLFEGLPDKLSVGLYHSLIVSQTAGKTPLDIDARSPEGEVMALSHRERPIYGVQFHPESVLTVHGYRILENFLRLARQKAPA